MTHLYRYRTPAVRRAEAWDSFLMGMLGFTLGLSLFLFVIYGG